MQEPDKTVGERKTSKQPSWIWIMGIAAYGFFVWPTPYVVTPRNGTFARVNRLTGVEEISSTNGWRSRNVIADAATEREEQEEKIVRDVRSEAGSIPQESDQSNFLVMPVNNPSRWNLTSAASGNANIEYFSVADDGARTFLGNTEQNVTLKANCHQDIVVGQNDEIAVLKASNLPADTNIIQVVKISFDRASDTSSGDPARQYVRLKEPLKLYYERPFYSRSK